MMHDDPSIRREAIWAVANATAGGHDEVMRIMVERGIIQALGQGLKFEDPRTIFVALEGLCKVLESGKKISHENNPYAIVAEQFGIVDQLEEL